MRSKEATEGEFQVSQKPKRPENKKSAVETQVKATHKMLISLTKANSYLV